MLVACAALILAASSPFDAAESAAASAQPAPQISSAAQGSSEVRPIEIRHGYLESAGRPVEDFYCAPTAAGAHPAVILLHGAVPRGYGNAEFAARCRELAATGYYAMFLEYYSQAGPARAGDRPASGRGFAGWANANFPVWTREIADGVEALGHNPAIERDRIALLGYSLGAFLALAVGASEGGRVAAVIEYYGAMDNSYIPMAANMPPTLILHGSADTTIPVRYAYALDNLLTRYNRPHEMKIYPGAGHGLDPKSRADAWQQTLDFLRRYLGR
jgi:carboxymethylenebutenolidase